MTKRIVLPLLTAWAVTLGAQETGERDRSATRSGDGTIAAIQLVPPAPQFVPFSPKQKLTYNIVRTFDPGALTRTTLATAFDQIMDAPEPWPGDIQGAGIRFSSKIGHRLVKHVIMAGVQTAMHDDPRKIPTKARGFLPRAREAVINTYLIQHDDGVKVHFNYARLVAAYGSAFVSRTWHPPGYRSSGDALVNGTATLVIDAGMSVVWEFWPDIKRKLFRH